MLLIHVPKLTNRLGYTLNILFKHVLHTDFNITTDEEYFLSYSDEKLCYGPRRLGDSLHLKNCKLLFQTSIEEQQPRPFQHNGQWMLFPVYGQDLDLPFDPLAATFYMVSRYEEYLPHREDEHGRFFTCESLAYTAGFKDEPVVDQWACLLKDLLEKRYPQLHLPTRSYRFVQTVDIDAAWCFLHKGAFRTVVGSLRDLIARHDASELRLRWRVLTHREDDPYDTFDYIIEQNKKMPGAYLLFFCLMADYDQFDKPANHNNPHTRQLLQHLGDYAKMGIHPGYNSLEQPHNVDEEAKRLESILHRTIVRSRYHFLRLQLPTSYRILQHAGIRHDYTMGYADDTGFRAGITSPYPFYDLERDIETKLTIHPFCVMDTTLQKYLRMTPDEGVERYKLLIDKVRSVDGTFCCIIHNQNLCERYGWQGWRNAYERMLELAKP